ncbi:hypothetical protein BAZSYMA_ACONTIG36109_0 [Bathymodiolus azoricus thioautotrophic gill symbiont]|uniref:Uncharacterized protein n=1 Tax=Bathymodiolus azoricus thioautotrophic gill symbiont TaxID=235205 RepID=A0A1H6LVG6_9GAMM|nr:hypothetical protein BAZSYMA_ACONTIG36109_0 [Bathymodiolus azoricus thioautotrophic gill symbiont]
MNRRPLPYQGSALPTELGEHNLLSPGAGNENRTRLIGLEGQGNTNIRYPQILFCFLVEGEGFEPSKAEPTDLQSVPFGHSGTPPQKAIRHYPISYYR